MNQERGTLKRLKLLPQLFRKQDAEKITPHAGMFLSRAVQKGIIYRVNRGNYVNSFLCGMPGVEQVACFLRPPAYISCEWALHFHGVTLQSPTVCTVVTLGTSVGKSRSIQYQGVTIEFSKISPSLFFGFTHQDGFCIASPEKAILDTLHYRRALPAQDELELESVDLEVLSAMAGKFSKSISLAVRELSGSAQKPRG
jgi:hypothetical protein